MSLKKPSFRIPHNVIDLKKEIEKITNLHIDKIKNVSYKSNEANTEMVEVVFDTHGHETNFIYIHSPQSLKLKGEIKIEKKSFRQKQDYVPVAVLFCSDCNHCKIKFNQELNEFECEENPSSLEIKNHNYRD